MHNFLREERNCCLFSVLLPPRSPEIWFLNLFYSTKTDNRQCYTCALHLQDCKKKNKEIKKEEAEGWVFQKFELDKITQSKVQSIAMTISMTLLMCKSNNQN